MNFEHVSVMLMPTVDMLDVREGGIYVDGTLGGGGHSAEILRRLKEYGMTRFQLLFRGSRSRSEIVATFIAVLELCREKVIHLAGSDTDCTVECGDDAPESINL